jgi:hypothetical protein
MENESDKSWLRIAGLDISILNATGLPMLVEEGYGAFYLDGPSESADLTVTVRAGTAPVLKESSLLLYRAQQDDQVLWEIYHWADNYLFHVFDQEQHQLLRHVALADASFKHWEIWTEPIDVDGELGICPLLYPMGPLLMYYLTVRNDAIMIHASGVDDGERGRIFSGFSGVGKSTMAGIWQRNGATVINDDRLIIRYQNGEYRMHNTPMFYADSPRSTVLHAVFLPFHSPTNTIEQLSGSEAVSRLMAYCIQHGYEKRFIEHHLQFLADLCEQLPVYSLGVVPTDEVIGFIKSHEHRA